MQHIPLFLSIMFHWSIKSNLSLMPFSSFYLGGSYLLQSKFNLLASIITKLCNQWQPKNICTVPKRTIQHGSNMWFHSSVTNIYILPCHIWRWQTIHDEHLPKAPDIPKTTWEVKNMKWEKSMTKNLNKCCSMLRRCFNWYSKVTLLL
jgi:hypothetical protein